MPRRSPLLLAIAVVVLLAAGCADAEPTAIVRDGQGASADADGGGSSSGGGGASASGDAPAPNDDLGPAEPAEHAELSAWEGCEGVFECATLTVPRDWADPEGDTLEIAVSRSTAMGDRIGSLLLNPGGPGASGVGFLQSFVGRGLPDGLTTRFDVVSWDPRGTGGENRIDCTTDEQWLEPDIDPTVEDEGDVEAIRAEAEEGVAACEDAAGDLLPVVGTRATVRDLDALRALLGDEQLTYLGYSYGTTIGMEYLRMYPGRVRAMILDGVSVPGQDPIDDAHVQAQGFERTLDSYLDGCADRDGCTLGSDPKATLLDLVERLEGERIEAGYQLGDGEPRRGTLGVGELYIAVAASLYDDAAWSSLDQGLEEALAEDPSGRTLLAIRDQYIGREGDGTFVDDADARGTIRCADQAERSEQPEGDLALVDEWAAELPFWGAWFATALPGCWGAPEAVDPLLPLAAGDLTDVPPVLVIGTTNDPATPYEQAEDAAEIIDGSVLVTYEGDIHTAFRSISGCVDEVGVDYLIDLTVPDDGLRCD